MWGESFAVLSRARRSWGSCREQRKIFINHIREGSGFGQLRLLSRMAESQAVRYFPGGLKFLISYVAVDVFTPGNCTSLVLLARMPGGLLDLQQALPALPAALSACARLTSYLRFPSSAATSDD